MHIFFSRITDKTLTKLGFWWGPCCSSMNCPFCCFLRFIFINYTSEWVIADYRHISNLNYTIAKTSYIRWDGIDVHFVYYINTISWFFRHVAPLRHIIPIQSQPVIEFWTRNTQ